MGNSRINCHANVITKWGQGNPGNDMTPRQIIGLICFSLAIRVFGEASYPKLEIYYSSNRQGEIEPCGCQVNQLGGMDRLKTYFSRPQSGYSTKTALFVDAGDSFFSMANLNERRRHQEVIKARLIAQANRLLKLDFFSPGERDFAGGLPLLKELEKTSGATFLSANLVDKQEKLIFEAMKIVERSGIKVGVFGLAGEEAFAANSEVKVLPALATAKKVVAELKEKGAQWIVGLSHLGLEQDRELAKIEGIDTVVGSHSLDALANPVEVEKTWIVQPLNQGQQIGRIEVTLSNPRLRQHWITDLDKSYHSKNEVSSLIDDYREQVRKLAMENTGKETAVTSATPYVAHPQHCRTCHQKQFDFWATTKHSSAYMVLFSKNQHFNPECISCHSLGYKTEGGFFDISQPIVLSETPAAPRGKKAKKADGPFVEKLMKTVFGAELKKGALSSVDPKQGDRHARLHKRYDAEIRKLEEKDAIRNLYIGVQCEHCHGNRHGHPDANVPTLKKVADDTCKNCHAAPNATEFTDTNFAAAKAKIACPLSSAH